MKPMWQMWAMHWRSGSLSARPWYREQFEVTLGRAVELAADLQRVLLALGQVGQRRTEEDRRLADMAGLLVAGSAPGRSR